MLIYRFSVLTTSMDVKCFQKLTSKHVLTCQLCGMQNQTHCMSNSSINLWRQINRVYYLISILRCFYGRMLNLSSYFLCQAKKKRINKHGTYGSYTSPPASVTITAPPATSLSRWPDYVNHISNQPHWEITIPFREAGYVNHNSQKEHQWKLWYHTMDPQSQAHKIDQAFHMQFHRDLMHKSQSFEGISPDQKRN